MPLDAVNSFVTLLVAISLAAERFVAVAKTISPSLAVPEPTSTGAEDATKDRGRRLTVMALALFASWLTATFVAYPNGEFHVSNFLATAFVGKIAYSANSSLPVMLVAFLASGGSAFWNQVLGYTKAARDARQQDNAIRGADQAEAVQRTAVSARRVAIGQPDVRKREDAALESVKRSVNDRYNAKVVEALRGSPGP